MKKLSTLLLFSVMIGYQASAQPTNLVPDAGNIIYVDINVNQSGPGYNGNGSSWAQAVPELADALEWARIQSETGDPVWGLDYPLKIYVAKGTYRPLYEIADVDNNGVPTDNKDRSFRMARGVHLYGGFAAGETDPEKRNLVANETVLTGSLGGTSHVYHVVLATAAMADARLDGFTVSNGRAIGSSTPVPITRSGNNYQVSRRAGGGIFISYASLTIDRVIIKDNTASEFGAGIYNNTATGVHLLRSTIRDNAAGQRGGGMYNANTIPAYISHVIIRNNSANEHGGGIANQSTSPDIVNTLLYDNRAEVGGGAIYNVNNASPTLTNVTIAANYAANVGSGFGTIDGGGGIHNNFSSSPKIRNTIFWGNTVPNNASRSNHIYNQDVSSVSES